MNFKEIAENYSKDKRKMMTEAVIKNQNHMRNLPRSNLKKISKDTLKDKVTHVFIKYGEPINYVCRLRKNTMLLLERKPVALTQS